jgi:hypothetical protein
MIEYSSNIDVVVAATLARIKELQNNPDTVLRTVALAVMPELRHRVHVEGKDSAGNQIGIYSPGYMKVRTGNYENSKRVTRGENKGKLKDAGTVTKRKVQLYGYTGVNVFADVRSQGIARPQYHRTADPKVILALTSQMENDLSVIPTDNGYGIGYLNPFNFQKSEWCEETYHKPILSKLMESEKVLAVQSAEQFTADYLK